MNYIPFRCVGCGQIIGHSWVAFNAPNLPGVVIKDDHECAGRWAS